MIIILRQGTVRTFTTIYISRCRSVSPWALTSSSPTLHAVFIPGFSAFVTATFVICIPTRRAMPFSFFHDNYYTSVYYAEPFAGFYAIQTATIPLCKTLGATSGASWIRAQMAYVEPATSGEPVGKVKL